MQTLNTLDVILTDINKLKQVVESIASQCDGAFTQDGVGFNKFDSNKMKTFLASEVSSISYVADIYKSLGKYKKQMDKLGVYEDYQSIKIEDSSENNSVLDEYRRKSNESRLNEKKQHLLDLVEAQPSKLVKSLNKVVKSLTITTENKWIWDLYNVDRSWFKTAGLNLRKNDYEGGVWQIQKWSNVATDKVEATTPSAPKLVDPSEVQISDELRSKLLVFQVDHVKYLLASLQNFNACLDASDTGTGKTFSALACAVHLGKIPVILTPKSVIPSWIKACKHFGISEYLVYNYEAVKSGKHSFLTKKGDEYTWNLSDKYVIIFDEAHRCKNKTTLNAQMLYSSKQAKIPVIALSATIADNPSQMYAIGYVLGLFGDRAYTRWLKSLQMYYDPSTYSYSYTKESLLLLNKQVFPKRGHRISVKELGDLFPETRILPETFTVSETTQKRINQLYNIIDEAILSLREKEKNDSGHHLTEMLRARQEIELLKLPIFVELAQDALEENNSVVIIVNFTETLNLLSQKLGTKCVVHGQQTAQEREKNIADFQSDKERIIIMNIRSGGVGVSLHDLNGNHPRVSLISPSWSAQDVVQAVGRVWRAGSKSSSIQKIVYCANTIEEDICDKMKSKIDNISTINEASVSEVFATLELQE